MGFLTTNFFGQYEGEQFQNKSPPANFDAANPYADPVAAFEQRDWIVREKMVQVGKVMVVRDALQDCYRTEGVNHYKNCAQYAKKYLELIKGSGVHRINHDSA